MNTATNSVIEVENLTYSYKNHRALNNATFAVEARAIHGFVGPNGAGKTTTLKILATLIKPQSGAARVFGLDIGSRYKQVRRRIGFMPDHLGMYRQMTVFEYLDFFAAAYGMGLAARDRTIKDVLALTDMQNRKDDFIRTLSTGMLQRVSLARVLVHDPELLLLDEPAAGLDPRARIELMEILQELRRMGKTIFISSHILSELAMLCDHVTIIDRGAVKFTGAMKNLLARNGSTPTHVVTLTGDHAPTEDALRRLPGILDVAKVADAPRYSVSFDSAQTTPNAILQAVIAAGGQVVSFQEDVKHLNQAFMDLTEPGVPPVLSESAKDIKNAV